MKKQVHRVVALAVSLFSLMQPTMSHSWVEQLTLIAPNGTFVGEPGYPRGNVLRGSPGFADPKMTYLLPPIDRPGNEILPSDNICKDTQRTQTQTEGSPRLRAPPGAAIALRYQENGHVSLPDGQPGKPPNRGDVYVYGTTDPRPDDTLLSIHKVWTADGTGGDGRGMLLSRQNYDDGRCYQVNSEKISTQRQAMFPHKPDQLMGADLWCQQDIALPQNVPVGKPYTLYWVWDWPTAPGVDPGLPDGKVEIYTTCMDIDIVPESELETMMKTAVNRYVSDQDLNRAAIPSQMASLNRQITIPDGSSISQTPTTEPTAALSETSAAQSATNLLPVTSTAAPCPYGTRPTSTALPAIFPIPTSAFPGQPWSISTSGARAGYRVPRAVSEDDTVYEVYKRLKTEDTENESVDVHSPIYRSPRLPAHNRGRRFLLW